MNFSTSEVSSNHTSSSLTGSILEFVVLAISLTLGLPAHSFLIWLVVMGKGREAALGIFHLSLSVCEIGNLFSMFFFELSNFFSPLSIVPLFFQGLAITGRPMFQILMCVERFLAVVHPVTFLKLKPLRYRIFCCSVAWTITLASSFFSFFVFISSQYIAFLWFYSIQLLVFLSVQLFCLVSILRALKQSGPGERKEENHRKRRAFNLILIITVSMTIIYSTYTITGLLGIIMQEYINSLSLMVMICTMFGAFEQPLLYLHRAGKLSQFTCLVGFIKCGKMLDILW